MSRLQAYGMAALGAAVAGLAGIASAIGVFARGDGAYQTVTSVRGVTYEMATSGVYAFNARQVVAEGVGWDAFTLFAAVPAMFFASFFVARVSFRGRLAAIGMFGYFFYQYLEYAVTWAFGPLFPLFIGIYAGSLAGIVGLGTSLARDGLTDRFERFPRRSFALLNVSMALLLTVMWMGRIATALGGDLVGAAFYGETTMVVQALDLGLVIPTALFAAYLVMRRSQAGYALAAAFAVTFIAMSAAIVAMLLSAGVVNGEFALPPIATFGAFIALSALVALRIYGGVQLTGVETGLSQARPLQAAAGPAHG